jgi:hypothetical protein
MASITQKLTQIISSLGKSPISAQRIGNSKDNSRGADQNKLKSSLLT